MLPLYLYPLFPLIGFLILIAFGRSLRGSLAGWLGSLAVFASFVVAVLNFFTLGSAGRPVHELLWTWLPDVARGGNLSAGLYLDQLSAIMTLVITGVGFLIHVFSIGYMADDPRFARFFAFLNFFVALMLILVLGDSYPLIFVGWEGVGLASYLLIGFWYAGHRDGNARDGVNNSNAARKAFIMNRIGDLGFMLAMFLIFNKFGTLSIPQLFAQPLQAARPAFELICLLLLVGAAGKSAQLPLTTWLPDAMAGPTPVSALIHAATMVTAGVYLIARSHLLFEQAPSASLWVAIIGGLTALYGALSALNQYDIKKILAFSTVSQLGYMFMAVGLGAYTAGIFHLVTHAFFKALLFLAAGSVIHAVHEEQDVRRMGGLAKFMPSTNAVSLIGVLAISGIPIFAGFFSKDSILAAAWGTQPVLYWTGLFVALLTAFYMGRWYLLVFRGSYRGDAHPHESGPIMTVPLWILAILATVGGFLGVPAFLRLPNALNGFLGGVLPLPKTEQPLTAEIILTVAAVGIALLGLYIAYARYKRGTLVETRLGEASLRALYLDNLYDSTLGNGSKAVARGLASMDAGVDGAIVGTAEAVAAPGRAFALWESGFVRSYAVSMLLGTAAILLYWAFAALGVAK